MIWNIRTLVWRTGRAGAGGIMKNLLLCIALIFASSSALPAQTAAPTPASDTTVTSPANDRITGTKINELPKAKDIPVFADRPGVTAPTYVRPDAKTRQKRYVKSVVGPVAIGRVLLVLRMTRDQRSHGLAWPATASLVCGSRTSPRTSGSRSCACRTG